MAVALSILMASPSTQSLPKLTPPQLEIDHLESLSTFPKLIVILLYHYIYHTM